MEKLFGELTGATETASDAAGALETVPPTEEPKKATEAKRARGRPKAKRRRNFKAVVMCYEEEKDHLNKMASEHSVTVSSMTRILWSMLDKDELVLARFKRAVAIFELGSR